jgi:hypothetical protein
MKKNEKNKNHMQLSLRRVLSERAENISVGKFIAVGDDDDAHVYKLCERLQPGTYCVYASNTLPKTDCVACYTCNNVEQGVRLLCYRLKRQRIWPIFVLEETVDNIYLVMGETPLHCQELIENVTHVKVIAGP